jgi:hypothetical protein
MSGQWQKRCIFTTRGCNFAFERNASEAPAEVSPLVTKLKRCPAKDRIAARAAGRKTYIH